MIKKTLSILLDFAVLSVTTFVVTMLFFADKATQDIVNLDFLLPQIESSINENLEDISISVENARLINGRNETLFMLELQNVTLKTIHDDSDIIDFRNLQMGLSLFDLVRGELKLHSMYMDNISVNLVRTKDEICIANYCKNIAGSTEQESEPAFDNKTISVDRLKHDITKNLSLLEKNLKESTLHKLISDSFSLHMNGIKLSLDDKTSGLSWVFPNTDFSISYLKSHLFKAEIKANLPEIDNSYISLSFAKFLERKNRRASLVIALNNFSVNTLANYSQNLSFLEEHESRIDCFTEIKFDKYYNVNSIDIDVKSDHISLYLPELYPDNLNIDNLNLSAGYIISENKIIIDEMSLDAKGVEINASSSVTLQNNGNNEQTTLIITKLGIKDVTPEQLTGLFPDNAKDTDAYEWLNNRISDGVFTDIKADLAVSFDFGNINSLPDNTEDSFTPSIELADLNFTFKDMTIDYQAPLQKVSNASGSGSFDFRKDMLEITSDEVNLGVMKARNVRVYFDELLKIGGGNVNLSFDLDAPLPAILKYLATEPIAYGAGIISNPDNAIGESNAKVKISFPTVKDLKKEQVNLEISGTVKDISLPSVVQGLDLTSPDVAINISEGIFSAQGSGKLQGREISFKWQEYLFSDDAPYESKIEASIKADQVLREHFGVNIDEYISGTLPVDIIYTTEPETGKNGKTDIKISADLSPVMVNFDLLDYTKPSNTEGKATLDVILQNEKLSEIKNFTVNISSASFDNAELKFDDKQELSFLKIDDFRMEQNRFSVLIQKNENSGVMETDIKGNLLDARPFLEGRTNSKNSENNTNSSTNNNKISEQSVPFSGSVTVDKMITHENRYISDVKMFFVTGQNDQIRQLEIDAKSGNGTFYMRYKPLVQNTENRIQIEATDAGSTLANFGINKDVRGGKLVILGNPSGKLGSIYNMSGTLVLTDFKVVNTPILAKLLGSMSLDGIIDLLNDQGISFSRLESDFDWLFKEKGNLLVFRNGRTSGNSLGLTFEGTVDKASNQTDISGTIVPVSTINSLIGKIPLVGEVIGHKGAVFAATYSIKGSPDDLKTSVNPLAALAPGILRTILFESNSN